MNCEQAKDLILELAHQDEALATHLATCEECRRFQALHQALDQQLASAYKASALSPAFRTSLQRRIRLEKRKNKREWLPPLVAPSAALATSGLCALLVPEISTFFLSVGLATAVLGFTGHVLFVWLTEELGEG